VKCSCCGQDRDPGTIAQLQCHDDIGVCRDCLGWLAGQVGLIDVTPTLPVVDMSAAVAFYEAAGFEVHVYEGGGFAFVRHDGQSVFDLGEEPAMEPMSNRAGCYLVVANPDEWHARLSALSYPVSAVSDQDHLMREFTLTDPSGNGLRFGRPT
jgi:hypothetical protein